MNVYIHELIRLIYELIPIYDVYYAIFDTQTNDGLELSMLYVSEDKWNWENEILELIEGYPLAYYKNFDYDNESKFLHEPISYISFN